MRVAISIRITLSGIMPTNKDIFQGAIYTQSPGGRLYMGNKDRRNSDG